MSDLSEIFGVVQESLSDSHLFDKGRLSSAIIHDADTGLKSVGAKLYNLSQTVSSDNYSDGIEIPVGTTTLTDEDFSTLYPDVSENTVDTSSGSSLSVLQAEAHYGTEMHGSYCRSFSNKDYNLMDVQHKAVYELALLSKKYAYDVTYNDEVDVQTARTDYVNKVADYRAICDSYGYDWDSIITNVSWELQSDCAYDVKESSNILAIKNAVFFDTDRVVSNVAHKAIIQCGTPDFEDISALNLSDSGISYEDTLDVTPEYTDDGKTSANMYKVSLFITNLTKAFMYAWENYVPHPFRAISNLKTAVKDGVKESIQNLDALNDAADVRYEQQYDNVQKSLDDTANAVENVKDAASEIADAGKYNVETIKEAVTEEVNQISDGENHSLQDAYSESTKSASEYVSEGIDYLKNGAEYGIEKTKEYISEKRAQKAESILEQNGVSPEGEFDNP